MVGRTLSFEGCGICKEYVSTSSAPRRRRLSHVANSAFLEAAGGARNLWCMMRIDNLRERIAKLCPNLDQKGLDVAEENIRQYVLLALQGDQKIDLGSEQALSAALTRTGSARDNTR